MTSRLAATSRPSLIGVGLLVALTVVLTGAAAPTSVDDELSTPPAVPPPRDAPVLQEAAPRPSGLSPRSLAEPGSARRHDNTSAVLGNAIEASRTSRPASHEATRPVRVRVPGHGVDAIVAGTGLDAERRLLVPPPDLAGWYERWPRPGEPGAAILVGHVDSHEGPAVFHGLLGVGAGAVVEVERADGVLARFVVDRVEQHPKDDFPTQRVYGPVTTPELRLITCGGPFLREQGSYRDNVIVFAQLVELGTSARSPSAPTRLGQPGA